MLPVVGATILVVIAHNVIAGRAAGEAATVTATLALTGALVAVARRSGLTARSVGLVVGTRSLVPAVAAATVTAVAITALAGPVAAAAGPVPRPTDLWFHVFVSIPAGTALCEEVIFRGVLLAALDRLTRPLTATLCTSALFGLWHIAAEIGRLGHASPAVLGGVVATAAASALVLVPLRRWSGDLAAPVAVHAAANITVLLVLTH